MPPHKTPNRIEYAVTRLFRYPWVRRMITSRSRCPMDHPYAKSIQSEKAEGKKALVARTKNASLFVSDLDASQRWYENAVGLRHLKTGESVPHPYVSERTIQVRAMGFGTTPDLFLVLQRDKQGKIVPVTTNGLSHIAFWIESTTVMENFAVELKRKGFALSYGPVKHYEGPGGDGGWGGNRAVYMNDPDGHFIEFSNEMDEFGRQYPINT